RSKRIPRPAEDFGRDAQPRPGALLVEFGRDAIETIDGNQSVHCDPEFRLPAFGDLLHPALEVGRGREQAPALVEELAPGRREHCPMSRTVEELDAQGLLKLA